MAKRTPKQLSKQEVLRKEWKKQYYNLKRRTIRWSKQGLLFTDLPVMPKRVTEQSIQRLKDIKLKSLSPSKRKKYSKAYNLFQLQQREEYGPQQKVYIPPTESEYLSGIDSEPIPEPNYWDKSWGKRSVTITTMPEELDQWFEDKIHEITSPNTGSPFVGQEEREERSERLKGFMYDARNGMGDEAFYRFLLDPEIFLSLQISAEQYINESNPGMVAADLNEFLTILNGNRPLTQEQEETVTMFGAVDFDYTGTPYE